MDILIVLIGILFTLSVLAIMGLGLLLLLRSIFRCISRNPTREELEKAQLARLMPRSKPDDDKP